MSSLRGMTSNHITSPPLVKLPAPRFGGRLIEDGPAMRPNGDVRGLWLPIGVSSQPHARITYRPMRSCSILSQASAKLQASPVNGGATPGT